ncbi:MAG: site-specific integrase [Gammaproteobacteria bacterium]|nr:site-specific integrase [Gammaproteobacteria bacterium]
MENRLVLNHQHVVPIERQWVPASLDGSHGFYRNPGLALSQATTDLAAIHEWLTSVAAKSVATQRSYRKEAERLLAWAIVERQKPMSSLGIEDMAEFEKFLKTPVSMHDDISWIAKKHEIKNEKGVVIKTTVKRYRRTDPLWRPFDGPLTPSSIEHAMKVLKSLLSFWVDVGYTTANPLKVRKRAFTPNPSAVTHRVLSTATWHFLYQYLENQQDALPEGASEKQRLPLLRAANQQFMIFTALYLLGVRIAELASIRMADFTRKETASGEDHYWVTITGKGNKTRDIPVPGELMGVITQYRTFLNTFTVRKRRAHDPDPSPLSLLPSLKDESPLILSTTGTKGLSTSALHKIIKKTLADALSLLKTQEESGVLHAGVNVDQLKNASAHWFRHTSATHQGLKGVSLRYVKDYLGHASFDTTIKYDHLDDEQWVKEISKFSMRSDMPYDKSPSPPPPTALPSKSAELASAAPFDLSSSKQRTLSLWLRVEKNQGWVRNVPKVRKYIETRILPTYNATKLTPDGWDYRLTIHYQDEDDFGTQADELIDEMEDVANQYFCFIEHSLIDEQTEREWYSKSLGWSDSEES